MASNRNDYIDDEIWPDDPDDLDDIPELRPALQKKPKKSRSVSGNARQKIKSKPRHPDPWDDDWYDPEDIL